MWKDKLRNIKRTRATSRDLYDWAKRYCSSNKMFLLTFYLLYLAVFAISLFVALNYESEVSHDNYYYLLTQGEYSYIKVTLKYLLYDAAIAFVSMITYRKKYTFACLYFLVTFIAYRLAVNIVGSWQYSLVLNILNTVLFYVPIFMVFVVVIVTTVCYINTNYAYCNDHCPFTLKKMLTFTLALIGASFAVIMMHTLLYPFLTAKILF